MPAITFPLSIDADGGDHPGMVHGHGYGRSDRTGNVLVVVCRVQRSSEGRQKRDGIVPSFATMTQNWFRLTLPLLI